MVKKERQGETQNQKERREFFDRKRQVYEMERNNENKIIFFRQNKLWWRLGGTSAVIYSSSVCKRLGYVANLRKDPDVDYFFEEGVCSIKNDRMRLMEEQMLIHDIKLVEKTEDDIWIFELPEKYSKRVIMDIVRGERIRRQKLYEELIPSHVMEETAIAARRMTRTVDMITMKRNKNSGKVVKCLFESMAESVVNINDLLIKIAKRKQNVEAGINKIKILVENFKDLTSEAAVSSSIDVNLMENLVSEIKELEKAIIADEIRIKKNIENDKSRR